jgi:hypothetical protein
MGSSMGLWSQVEKFAGAASSGRTQCTWLSTTGEREAAVRRHNTLRLIDRRPKGQSHHRSVRLPRGRIGSQRTRLWREGGFQHSVPRKTPAFWLSRCLDHVDFPLAGIRKRRHEVAYLSSHTSSRRLPLKMLVTMKRQPLEVGLPADPAASIEGDRPGAVLWMAATLEEAANEGDGTWSEFALVARDLGRRKAPRRHTPTSLDGGPNFVNRTNGRYRSAAEEPVVRIHSPPARAQTRLGHARHRRRAEPHPAAATAAL